MSSSIIRGDGSVDTSESKSESSLIRLGVLRPSVDEGEDERAKGKDDGGRSYNEVSDERSAGNDKVSGGVAVDINGPPRNIGCSSEACMSLALHASTGALN